MHRRWHAHPDLADTAEETLQGQSDLRSQVSAEKVHDEGIECFDVLFEVGAGEVGVSFHNVDDNRPPRIDVSLIYLFVEDDVAFYDVGTKPI